MDPIICCALGICCPPLRQQEEALGRLMKEQLGIDDNGKVAAWMLATFDLMPKGSTGDLKKAMAAMMRQPTKDKD